MSSGVLAVSLPTVIPFVRERPSTGMAGDTGAIGTTGVAALMLLLPPFPADAGLRLQGAREPAD